MMNVVMIIPTGIGCEIGGHAGDATPAARLLGSVCDQLILHPNVVNASDINEMPECMYVEGSILDRFLEGKIELQEVKSNRILVVVNSPVKPETVNAVSASRVTLGIDAKIVELKTPLRMIGGYLADGSAGGEVYGVGELVEQVKEYDFDALAIASLIEVLRERADYYWKSGGVNPWGGVEAVCSRMIAEKINKPTAHAPIEPECERERLATGWYDFVCDPRIAPEIISECYLHCVLKGLHKAPRPVSRSLARSRGLGVEEIDVMVSPVCWGKPHDACLAENIPIVMVRENQTIYSGDYKGVIWTENYLEAAGVVAAMGEGICLPSLRRPLNPTEVINAVSSK